MHTPNERAKLLNRIKRIQGQTERIKKTLEDNESDSECAELLMQLAAVRGGINSLMAEILEHHIREHLLAGGSRPLTPDIGEELIDLVRAYLK
jgi:DNA-binding FrmR family transcriptional regulator